MSLRRDVRMMAEGWRWSRQSLVPRSAVAHTPVKERREFPTAWARTPAARAVRDTIHAVGLKPLVWSQTRPRVHGLDHLDGLAGPVLFVSNHASHLDAPLLLCSLPPAWRSKTAVGAASDYFFDARWRALGTALVFSTFPVDRYGGGTATAGRLLAEGWSLVLFPEGTRSSDGWMQRFKHGSARLALEHGVPIVPLAIRGSYAAMPKGRSWPRPGRPPVSVRFGPPVWPDAEGGHRVTSQRASAAVARLWDEDETDWYGSLRRAATDEAPVPTGPEAAPWRRRWEASEPLRRDGHARAWRRSR
jgi:1-acyl-sn-glycerol-3-phosphate acyltransferase